MMRWKHEAGGLRAHKDAETDVFIAASRTHAPAFYGGPTNKVYRVYELPRGGTVGGYHTAQIAVAKNLDLAKRQAGDESRFPNPKKPAGTPTSTNVFTMASALHDGGGSIDNRVRSTDIAHLKRCLAAGYLESNGKGGFIATEAGLAAMRRDPVVLRVFTEGERQPRTNPAGTGGTPHRAVQTAIQAGHVLHAPNGHYTVGPDARGGYSMFAQTTRSDVSRQVENVAAATAAKAFVDAVGRIDAQLAIGNRIGDPDFPNRPQMRRKPNPRAFRVGQHVTDEYGNPGVIEEVPKAGHRGAHYWVRMSGSIVFLKASEIRALPR